VVVAVSNRDLDNGRQGTTGVAFSGQHRHVSQPRAPPSSPSPPCKRGTGKETPFVPPGCNYGQAHRHGFSDLGRGFCACVPSPTRVSTRAHKQPQPTAAACLEKFMRPGGNRAGSLAAALAAVKKYRRSAHRKQQKYTHSQGQNPHLRSNGLDLRRRVAVTLQTGAQRRTGRIHISSNALMSTSAVLRAVPIRNARQPSSAFCCALGGWWLGRCGVAGAPVVHLRGGQEPNVGRGAVYTGIFVGTLATYAPIPAVFFSFSLLLSTSGRALVMLGPGAAHGCPPLSGACHRGAHQQKKTGGDPKSHVGAPGHYCSRGARRGVFFLLLPDAGALMGRRALGVASRGGAHPKWPL